VAILQGCGPNLQSAPPSQIATRDDTFQPYREFRSGRVTLRHYPNIVSYELIGRLDRKSGVLTTLIEVDFAYAALRHRHYNAARDARAGTLRLVPLRANGRCAGSAPCPHEEVFEVLIPEADLREAPAEGYALKVFAKDGPETVISIGKERILALLAAADGARKAAAR
jgi:hypothetical protein